MSNNPRTQIHLAADELRRAALDTAMLLERVATLQTGAPLGTQARLVRARLRDASDAVHAVLVDAELERRGEWADEVEGAIG